MGRLSAQLIAERESGVHRVGPRLSDEQLKIFATPKTWREIISTPRREGFRGGSHEWWRQAIMDADEFGRGLLIWSVKHKTWRLSPLGREHLGLKEEE